MNDKDKEKETASPGTMPNPAKKRSYTYKELVHGNVSIFYLIKYEIIFTLFSDMPGILGFKLRNFFFPGLFKKTGKGVVFGKSMTIRYPRKIEIGSNVVFEDYVTIDASGEDNSGLKIGDDVFIGRHTTIVCKGGDIDIGDNCRIGTDNILISESILKMGKYVFTGSKACMIAGGNYSFDLRDIPIFLQESASKGGIILDEDIWIGAACTILDGVRIGKGVVIGAGALVNNRIRPYTVNVGVPIEMIKKRD